MKYTFLLAGFLSFTATAEMSAEKPEWYACKTDGDCINTQFLCGMSRSINKRFVKDYTAWINSIKARCESHITPPPPESATCMESRCEVLYQAPDVSN